jgi:hypothetical protein
MDMRCDRWNVRCLYRAGSVMTVAKGISKYCLNKQQKEKQLNNKHKLYKEEKTLPGHPRAAIYPISRR